MLVFDDLEKIRSVQLYGTDPVYVGKAAEILCAEYGVAHIDLNFGCPVPKVTRKGGGGALPWKRGLLGEILTAAVGAATPYGVPVTMKTRKGIDEDHLTYLDAGRIAEDSGCAAIALHGRTVAQSYSGEADWDAIARLVEHVELPVLGNGDIWEAGDAVRMVEQTGAAGVVVGPRLPGAAVAVPRPGSRLRARRAHRAGAAGAGRGTRGDAPPRRAALRAHGGGARLQGVPQARLLVPQGLPRRWHAAPLAGAGRLPGQPRRAARRPRPDRAVPRLRARHARAVARARRGPRWPSPRVGSTTPTGPAATSRRRATRPPAGEQVHLTSDGEHPGEPGGRFGQARRSVLDSRLRVRFVINYPSREAARSLTVNSKGSALWQIIATSGTPMPAASSATSRPPRSSRPDSPSSQPPAWSPWESSDAGPVARDLVAADARPLTASLSTSVGPPPMPRERFVVSRSASRKQDNKDAVKEARADGAQAATATAVRRAVNQGTKLWTTTVLNLWTQSGEDAQQVGEIHGLPAGARHRPPGRRARRDRGRRQEPVGHRRLPQQGQARRARCRRRPLDGALPGPGRRERPHLGRRLRLPLGVPRLPADHVVRRVGQPRRALLRAARSTS